MANLLTAAIDIKLGVAPQTPDPVTNRDLADIYGALQILQLELSKGTRFIAQASVDITAGQYVAVSNVAGVTKTLLANATDNTKQAVGFALGTYTSGTWGVYSILGNNNFLTGLTPASQYYLSAATGGAATSTKPVGAGKIVQPLGFALTATELITNIASNYTQL